jgi:hypothetical protein
LELLLVRGGGAEQPPSIYILAVEFFFPCVELHCRAVHVPPPVSFESSPRQTTAMRRWILIQRQHTDSGF